MSPALSNRPDFDKYELLRWWRHGRHRHGADPGGAAGRSADGRRHTARHRVQSGAAFQCGLTGNSAGRRARHPRGEDGAIAGPPHRIRQAGRRATEIETFSHPASARLRNSSKSLDPIGGSLGHAIGKSAKADQLLASAATGEPTRFVRRQIRCWHARRVCRMKQMKHGLRQMTRLYRSEVPRPAPESRH